MNKLVCAAIRCLISLSKFAKGNFSKTEFNSIRVPELRIEYLTSKGFVQLGQGSGRVTFILSPKKALKLALNNRGVAQNIAEFNVLSSHKSIFFPKFYDKAPDSSWIEVELVMPITSEGDIERYFGLKFSDFIHLVGYPEKTLQNIRQNKNKNKNKNSPSILEDKDRFISFLQNVIQNKNMDKYFDYSSLKDNKRFISFLETILKSGIAAGAEISSLGNLGKNSSGDIVILDAGLSGEIYAEFYSGFSKEDESHKFTYPILPKYDSVSSKEWSSKDPKNIVPNASVIQKEIELKLVHLLHVGKKQDLLDYLDTLKDNFEDGYITAPQYKIYTAPLIKLLDNLKNNPPKPKPELDSESGPNSDFVWN